MDFGVLCFFNNKVINLVICLVKENSFFKGKQKG